MCIRDRCCTRLVCVIKITYLRNNVDIWRGSGACIIKIRQKKKSLNPSEWKKNKEKVGRCSSDGRQPKLACKHDDGRCQAIKLHLNDIKRFHSVFYSLKSKVEQDSFIMNSVLVQKTARNRGKLDKKSREFTIPYFVQSCNGDNIKVCCATMCSILRIDP